MKDLTCSPCTSGRTRSGKDAGRVAPNSEANGKDEVSLGELGRGYFGSPNLTIQSRLDLPPWLTGAVRPAQISEPDKRKLKFEFEFGIQKGFSRVGKLLHWLPLVPNIRIKMR
jgi:hypothetical protein